MFGGASKILKTFSWPINIWLKYFMTPPPQKKKPSGPFSCILNVWSLNQKLALILAITSQYIFKINTTFHFSNIISVFILLFIVLLILFFFNLINILTNKFHIHIV